MTQKTSPGNDETIEHLNSIIAGLQNDTIGVTDIEQKTDYGEGGQFVKRWIGISYFELVK